MSIASSLCAEKVNRTGAKVIKKMEKIGEHSYLTPSEETIISNCIALVKKHFTEWSE